MFKRIRIAILLFILASVAIGTWQTNKRVHAWRSTLYVTVYPINADGSAAAAKFISSLDASSFAPVEEYLEQQAHEHGISQFKPVRVSLGPAIAYVPPPRPTRPNLFEVMRWSLSIRYWAWLRTPAAGIRPDIRMYALFYDPAQTQVAPDSTGLAKAHIGLANLFATPNMQGSNLVVLTHEMLHALGATDHYDLGTGLPTFPDGYAAPNQSPLYPQVQAEIMAGRIPVSETRADIPYGLKDTLIGPLTAREIGWPR